MASLGVSPEKQTKRSRWISGQLNFKRERKSRSAGTISSPGTMLGSFLGVNPGFAFFGNDQHFSEHHQNITFFGKSGPIWRFIERQGTDLFAFSSGHASWRIFNLQPIS